LTPRYVKAGQAGLVRDFVCPAMAKICAGLSGFATLNAAECSCYVPENEAPGHPNRPFR
jgi:hypothetical protein